MDGRCFRLATILDMIRANRTRLDAVSNPQAIERA
jgi:hypothetical protein